MTKYADQAPLGFLSAPDAGVSIDEDAEASPQGGEGEGGAVITGMSLADEKRLYADLHSAHGKYSPERWLAWIVVLLGGSGIILADGLHLVSASLLAVAGLWLLKDRV